MLYFLKTDRNGYRGSRRTTWMRVLVQEEDKLDVMMLLTAFTTKLLSSGGPQVAL